MKIIQDPKVYHLFRFLIHFMKPQKGLFIVLILALFAWPLEQSFFPYFIKLIIDGLTGLETLNIPFIDIPVFKELGSILLLGVVFFITTEIIYRSSDFLRAYLLPPFMARIRTYLINYIGQQSFTYFSNNFPGAIANKINDLPRAAHELFEKTGAKEIKDMGKVMADLTPKIKGKADGGQASKIVKELLS